MRKVTALAGNRTRVPRVAGENSTTEPPMHIYKGYVAPCLSIRVKSPNREEWVNCATYRANVVITEGSSKTVTELGVCHLVGKYVNCVRKCPHWKPGEATFRCQESIGGSVVEFSPAPVFDSRPMHPHIFPFAQFLSILLIHTNIQMFVVHTIFF